jgi:hypothetical protein
LPGAVNWAGIGAEIDKSRYDEEQYWW